MSKELEALEHIKEHCEHYYDAVLGEMEEYKMVENALKKLEIIKKIEEFFSIDFAELFNNGLKIKNISITYTLGEICGGNIELE